MISTLKLIVRDTAEALELIEEMKHDAEDWEREEEVDLKEKYWERVREVGSFDFLLCLFQNYSDSTLMSLMDHFFFVWKDLQYQDWKELLYIFSKNSVIIYQFIWFCGSVLGINIGQVIQEDKQVHDLARNCLKRVFPDGTPKPRYPLQAFDKNGIEPATLWKRLKAEGAPMKVDV